MEFKEFPKIPRARRGVICTEKIDGTNACVVIVGPVFEGDKELITQVAVGDQIYNIFAQSRNRFVTLKDDNYRFGAWVHAHCQELAEGLGEGYHYGEWWGQGIQRNYGLTEKRFSLFNAGRWNNHNPPPKCCCVVPVVYAGTDLEGFGAVDSALDLLRNNGSVAAPGFMKPEGVIAFHKPSQYMFKATLEKDESPKGQVSAEKGN